VTQHLGTASIQGLKHDEPLCILTLCGLTLLQLFVAL
jgi:hypothetical protein